MGCKTEEDKVKLHMVFVLGTAAIIACCAYVSRCPRGGRPSESPGVVKTPQDPCVPVPRLDYGWLEHFAMNRQRISESGGEIDIVFMGDSLTHYWDVGEGPDSSTEIEDLRRTYSILNCAYGGDKTQNLLWGARNGLLDGYRAKLVQLLIGTNNSSDGTDPKDTFEAIRKIVAVICEKQPQAKVLLLNLLPRGTSESPAHRRNLEINALINSEKWDDAVIVGDIGGNFIDRKGNTIPELFDGERLHFVGETGYCLWRRAVEPVFRDVVGK